MADKELGALTAATSIDATDEIYAVVGGNSRRVGAGIAGSAFGTAFPGTPTSGMRFYRTDRNIEYFYDGTRWLSTTLFSATLDGTGGLQSANTQLVCAPPHYNTYSIYIEDFVISTFNTASTATNYFTAQLIYVDAGVTTNLGAAQSFQGVTQNQWVAFTVTIDTLVPSTADIIQASMTETGVQNAVLTGSFTYRIVG